MWPFKSLILTWEAFLKEKNIFYPASHFGKISEEHVVLWKMKLKIFKTLSHDQQNYSSWCEEISKGKYLHVQKAVFARYIKNMLYSTKW